MSPREPNTHVVRFKGGSLSGTYLHRPDGAAPFVRKNVSLTVNREYGFQRWYSQLKRLQRYQEMFPGIFPRLLTYGIDGDFGYFDIEYIHDAITAHTFVSSTHDRAALDRFLQALVETMQKMHRVRLPSSRSPLDLYIHEEIETRIGACMEHEQFRTFVAAREICFNGQRVAGLVAALDEYKEMAHECYRDPTETFTHGNLTLENILYQPLTNRVVFIDPYEENIIDSVLAEYSQIYQSCNSLYELYDASTPRIDGLDVVLQVSPSDGLAYFNSRFTEFLRSMHDWRDLRMIRLFEVSQYARMLPFKMVIDPDKMLLFYALGSYLFHRLRDEGS